MIWTRHRRAPDLTPSIRSWFDDAGYRELAFVAPEPPSYAVGAHRLSISPAPYSTGVRLFEFAEH